MQCAGYRTGRRKRPCQTLNKPVCLERAWLRESELPSRWFALWLTCFVPTHQPRRGRVSKSFFSKLLYCWMSCTFEWFVKYLWGSHNCPTWPLAFLSWVNVPSPWDMAGFSLLPVECQDPTTPNFPLTFELRLALNEWKFIVLFYCLRWHGWI